MKTGLFLLSLAVFLSIGFHQHVNDPPTSTHLGAQADRATLTYNYYTGDATFLYPKVLETRLNDGIVGCEFPGLYFLLGKLFKWTGFHYGIYRSTIFLFMLMGFYAIWGLLNLYTKPFLAALGTLLLCLSPIVAFYALNYLPDIPAFGLSLMGWYILLSKKHKQNHQLWSLVFFALAGLLKASYAVHLIVALSLLIVENKKLKYKVLLMAILSMGVIAAWYEWATYLNHTFQNPHFLLKPNPAQGFPDFLSIIRDNWINWGQQLYSTPLYLLIGIGVYAMFQNRKTKTLLFRISWRLLALSILFYLAFQTQFKYHDYYYIFFVPLSLFLLIHMMLWVQSKTPNNLILGFVFLLLVINGYRTTKEAYFERYKPDSYWYMPPMPGTIEKYVGIDGFLDSYLKEGEPIISAYDNTPNSTLFFMRRKGCRIAVDFEEELINEIIGDQRFNFLLVNDTSFFRNEKLELQGIEKSYVDHYKGIRLYSLERK